MALWQVRHQRQRKGRYSLPSELEDYVWIDDHPNYPGVRPKIFQRPEPVMSGHIQVSDLLNTVVRLESTHQTFKLDRTMPRDQAISERLDRLWSPGLLFHSSFAVKEDAWDIRMNQPEREKAFIGHDEDQDF